MPSLSEWKAPGTRETFLTQKHSWQNSPRGWRPTYLMNSVKECCLLEMIYNRGNQNKIVKGPLHCGILFSKIFCSSIFVMINNKMLISNQFCSQVMHDVLREDGSDCWSGGGLLDTKLPGVVLHDRLMTDAALGAVPIKTEHSYSLASDGDSMPESPISLETMDDGEFKICNWDSHPKSRIPARHRPCYLFLIRGRRGWCPKCIEPATP